MKPNTNSEFELNIAADLQRWRTFLIVAEQGSLTRAAIQLGASQSLLSRQINALERDCGTRLFVRTGRGVALSETGDRIFSRVKALLKDAQTLDEEIRGASRDPVGRVILGVLPSIGISLVPRLFAYLRAHFPGVHLKILEGSSGQVEEWLAAGRVDVAILYRYASSLPALEETLAKVDSFLIARVGDRLTKGPEVSFAKLHQLPFILPSAPNGLRTALDAAAKQLNITLEPVLEADSLPLQRALVEQEGLYTVLPLHAVWTEVQAKRLQASRIMDPVLQRSVSMAFAKSKGLARAVTTVATAIHNIVDEMAAHGLWHAAVDPKLNKTHLSKTKNA
jgi:LysR family transcriptional regulator, nitrogen assimilation regulatory protein